MPSFIHQTICIMSLLTVASTTSCLGAAAKTDYIRHFVSVKFKDTTSPEQVEEVLKSFKDMKSGIPEIMYMEWGPDISVEKRNKGYSHGFLLTFASEKDRDVYLKHPIHTKFLSFVKPLMEDIFVLDFLTDLPEK